MQERMIMRRPRQHRPHGFTLMELLVVLVVLGILSAVAYPNYQQYILRAHRAHAKTQLLQAAQWMEQAAAATGAYPDHVQHAPAIEALQTQLSNARYTIDITSGDGSGFTVTATPMEGQRKDGCGSLHLTHRGERSISNAPPNSGMTALQCWER